MIGTTAQQNHISRLSQDEMNKTFSFLNPKEIGRCASASSLFYKSTQENASWEDKLIPEAKAQIDPQDDSSAFNLFNADDQNRLIPFRSPAYFKA